MDIQANTNQTNWPAPVPLCEWEAKPMEWLWKPYLPQGMLTLLSGAPGVGKTYIALDIAARVTSGRDRPPADVLYLTAGDNPEHVLRPRFDGLGGISGRLHLLRADMLAARGEPATDDRRLAAGDCSIWLSNFELLDTALQTSNARLLIVDPLQSFLPSVMNSRRSETLRILDRLSQLAEDFRCGVLLVRSLRETRTHADSAAELAPVRSQLLAGKSPDDSRQRALLHVKSGLGFHGDAIGYVIELAGGFRWTGASGLNAKALSEPELGPAEMSAVDEAAAFLQRALAEGTQKAVDLLALAEEEGISEKTLRRAKKRLQVKSDWCNPCWFWYFPKPEPAGEQSA